MTYPKWTQSYSNEDFDRAQALALELTEQDRVAGRPAPKFGYTRDNFVLAERFVAEARG